LGLPSRHFSEFLELSADAFNAPSDMERAFAAVMRITEMWTEELAKRRSEPGDDLLTWLTQTTSPAGRRFTDEEIVEYARVLLPAGVDTTSRQIPTMLIML